VRAASLGERPERGATGRKVGQIDRQIDLGDGRRELGRAAGELVAARLSCQN